MGGLPHQGPAEFVFRKSLRQLGDCGTGGHTYADRMKFGRRLALVAGSLALGYAAAGCGGVNARGSVSPASFLLPGILYRTPEAKPLDAVRDPEVARVDPVDNAAAGQP